MPGTFTVKAGFNLPGSTGNSVAPAGLISGLNTTSIDVKCKENQIENKLADWIFEPTLNEEMPLLCTRFTEF